jgi:hypothetical protein
MSEKPVRPWDLFLQKERAQEQVAKERFNICKGCDHFVKLTKQCIKCGCFMAAKTKLPKAACPVGKWGPASDLLPFTLDENNTPLKQLYTSRKIEPVSYTTEPKNGMKSFYHLHIPKTAGTFLRSSVDSFVEPTLLRNGVRFIVDHGGWTHVDDLTYIFSSFRDPVERLISHFAHVTAISNYDTGVYIKNNQNLEVDELLEWVNNNLSSLTDFQTKNLFYDRNTTLQAITPAVSKNSINPFFINEPGFMSLTFTLQDALEKAKRINLLVKDSQLNNTNVQLIKEKIFEDFGLVDSKIPTYLQEHPFDNKSKVSTRLFKKIPESVVNYLYSISTIDTELYNTSSLFWKDGK